MIAKAVLIVTAMLIGACTHSVHQVHVSGFDPYKSKSKGKMIRAEAEQFVVMGFVQQTHYVNQAYYKLISQCKGGDIKGITTQYLTSHGFFSWTNKILMQGTCLR